MSSLTLRHLDPAVKQRLQVHAVQHDHSMQVEARDTIGRAVGAERPSKINLAEAVRRHFAYLGGAADLEIPPREPVREPPGWPDICTQDRYDSQTNQAAAGAACAQI